MENLKVELNTKKKTVKTTLKSKLLDKISHFKKMRITKKSLFIIIPLIFLLVFVFVYLIFNIGSFKEHEKLDVTYSLIKSNQEEIYSSHNTINIIPELKDEYNPINGNPITKTKFEELKNKKVFAVTINNHPSARPQSGLSETDITMEVLTEGGITRYVALFYENEPEKIGPVRSVRRYMLDFLAEYDSPVILHEGGATFNDSNEVYVRETDAIRDINQYGMKSMQSAGSRFRDNAKAQKAGYVHSLYTGYQLIKKEFESYAKNQGWERTSNIEVVDAFKFEATKDQREKGGKLTFSFLGGSDEGFSAAGFEYNINTNSYDRLIGVKPDIDENNGNRISPKNVVVEWHEYRPANDGYARIILGMIGEGKVVIYLDGKEIIGTWKKDSREARTRYYDQSGKEIQLNRGQIWKVITNKAGSTEYSIVNYEKYE